MPGREEVTGEVGKEEQEEEGDWGMTLAVGSKGRRGWRSLGKPCISCEWRRKQEEKKRRKKYFYVVLDTILLVSKISPQTHLATR